MEPQPSYTFFEEYKKTKQNYELLRATREKKMCIEHWVTMKKKTPKENLSNTVPDEREGPENWLNIFVNWDMHDNTLERERR